MSDTLFLPEAFGFLFTPALYKIVYGGRGGAKSRSIATALLAYGIKGRERVLCAREIQNSIAESVHQVLVDQILGVERAFGVPGFYRVTDKTIRGENGTEFFFRGLRYNAASIKSLEGITKCWVEEAESVNDNSWELLDPTIREEGAELWLSFNPALETDPTYQRFVKHPPPGSIVKKVSWRDNPFFPETLKAKMLHCKKVDPDTYQHVWEGGFKIKILGKKVYPEYGRARHVAPESLKPKDPKTIYTFWDNTGLSPAILLAYITALGQLRVFREFCFLDTGVDEATEAVILWCRRELPAGCTFNNHIGDPAGKNRDSSKGSPVEYIRATGNKFGWNIIIQDGQQNFKARREAVARRLLKSIPGGEPALLIDPDCSTLINGFEGGYVYPEIGTSGEYKTDPVKNEFSHPHDALQYGATVLFPVFDENKYEQEKTKNRPDPRDDPNNYDDTGRYML